MKQFIEVNECKIFSVSRFWVFFLKICQRIEKHCPQFEYSISMVVIDAFNPAVPELLHTPYLLSTISRRVYIVQRVGWQRWKIIERIIVIIPVASRMMAICWRLCGLPASTKESVVPPILAPTFCTNGEFPPPPMARL